MHLSFLSTEVIHTYSYLECNNQIPQIHRDTRPVEWGDEPYSGLDVYMFFLDTDTYHRYVPFQRRGSFCAKEWIIAAF